MKDLPEILEALGVEARPPSLAFLRELFAAFNGRVLFESASKIVRDKEESSSESKPRDPEIFWREHLELGAGGTCFARTAGFDELLRSLGFDSQRILASIRAPSSHAALLVRLEGKSWLVDVGYPLPEILPLERREIEGLTGEAVFLPDREKAELKFFAGPDAGRRIEFSLRPSSPREFREAWIRTFQAPSPFLENVLLRRQESSRVARFFRGTLEFLDSRTRTRLPAAAMPEGLLSEIFGIDAALLRKAFSFESEFDPPEPGVKIEAYLDDRRAPELFASLATPEGYRRYLSGLGDAAIVSREDLRFRVELRAGNGASTIEEIEIAPDGRALAVHRREGLAETGFRLEETPSGPRIVRYALLEGKREEMLRSDFARSRIGAILSMDLLALSRLSEL